MKKMSKVILNADEAEALADFLWLALIPFIQDKDNEVDNLQWINALTGIWKKCNNSQKTEGKA